MRNEWKCSQKLLGSVACVENRISEELAIVGRYGEIWSSSYSVFKAVIYSHRIAKRYLPKAKWPLDPQDEILVQFPTEDLALWLKRLRVPAKSSTQARLANRGNETDAARSNISKPVPKNLTLRGVIRATQQSESPHITKLDSRAGLVSGTENPDMEPVAPKKRAG